jgi:hypothetical protein
LKASAQAFQAEGKVSSDPVGKILENCVFIEENGLKVAFFFVFFTSTFLFDHFIDLIALSVCLGLQLLMPLEVFCLNGGRFSGTFLLLGLMRSTLRWLHRI